MKLPFLGEKLLRCSFCNKSQRDVKMLIAGPKVYICDECVEVCLGIVRENKTAAQAAINPPKDLVPN